MDPATRKENPRIPEGSPTIDVARIHALIARAVLKRKASTNGNGHGAEETFGRRLARLRKLAGYSQREFAGEIGISYRMVAYYEAQTDHPPAHLIPAIARALGVSADQLLGLEEMPKRRPVLNRRLLEKLKLIERLPPREQKPLLKTIDAYLKAAGRG